MRPAQAIEDRDISTLRLGLDQESFDRFSQVETQRPGRLTPAVLLLAPQRRCIRISSSQIRFRFAWVPYIGYLPIGRAFDTPISRLNRDKLH